MLNILPNIWINEDAIESLHFEKDSMHGDRLIIHMVSGKTYEVYEKINEVMRSKEIYKIPEVKPKVKRAYKKKVKPEVQTQTAEIMDIKNEE